jgi:CheY-like chemotaxis protein
MAFEGPLTHRVVSTAPDLMSLRWRRTYPWPQLAGHPMLYISGNPDARILFGRIAKRWRPIRLLVVEGGEAGLLFAELRRLSLIVIDATLPDASGFEIVERLRSRHPEVPVLVLGDEADSAQRARFVRAGAHAYLPAPLSVLELEQAVIDLLMAPLPTSPAAVRPSTH